MNSYTLKSTSKLVETQLQAAYTLVKEVNVNIILEETCIHRCLSAKAKGECIFFWMINVKIMSDM